MSSFVLSPRNLFGSLVLLQILKVGHREAFRQISVNLLSLEPQGSKASLSTSTKTSQGAKGSKLPHELIHVL